MNARIKFRGGANQQDRMVEDKLRSLKGALQYSYQAATVGLLDPQTGRYDREFRCLINPNKVNEEIDAKIISIPFEDIQLNDGSLQVTDVKPGSIVRWLDNDTYWLVCYQYLQERAYFRGMIRQCESSLLTIDGIPHHYCLIGPDEQNIDWAKSKRFIFNDLNYNIEIQISKTELTNQFFERFKKINIQGKPFEVQAVDRMSSDAILTVYLKEDFSNKWKDINIQDSTPDTEDTIDPANPYINGNLKVYPYETYTYTINGATGGVWQLSNKRAKIIEQSSDFVTIEIVSGRSGDVSLIYTKDGADIVKYNITIASL